MVQFIAQQLSLESNSSISSHWEYSFTEVINLREMMPILLNKYIRYPESVYSESLYKPKSAKNQDLKLYFIHIPANLLGVEFSKTHVYHIKEFEQKYAGFAQLVSGEVTLIAQKKHTSNPDYSHATVVDEVKLKSINSKTKVAIPSGFLFAFINNGNEDAIVSVICKNLQRLDYTEIIKEKGLAFYVISKNSRMEVVANPKYRVNKFCLDEAPDLRFDHQLLKQSDDFFSLKGFSDKLCEALA